MSDNEVLYVSSLCAAAFLALVWKWRHDRSRLPLPPGPNEVPLLGHALSIPKDVPVWETFTSITRNRDTDVIYLRLFTTDCIVLSSSEAISDLLDKRSSIYSDRPQPPMLSLMGLYDWSVVFMEYGGRWRKSRRLLHEFMSVRAVSKFDEYQRKHAHRFMLNLADSPENFFNHAEFAVAALVMETAYGLNIKSNKDRFLRAVVSATSSARTAMVPGSFLVDSFPILRWVPEWFPGAGFKTVARVARGQFDIAINEPLAYVKESMKSNKNNNPSIAWSCLDRSQEPATGGFDEDTIRAATGTMYAAAVGATTSILRTLFLAMALNPHVKRKAQEELDRVVGQSRLPDLSDQEDLPYISAIVKELFRWGCPVPIGVPKRVMEDDTYNGYHIPAGATVIENVWAIFRDEFTYPAPHMYDPERYLKDGKLDPSVKDPAERIFGSGRRICPGRHLAVRLISLNVASILALFNIEPPVGETLEAKFAALGFARHAVPFKCKITPRSEASMKLIQSVRDATDY